MSVMLLLFSAGRLGLVLGEPTGVEFYIPSGKNNIDFQLGFSYPFCYFGVFGGYEFDIMDFGNITPEFKNFKLYLKPGICGELMWWIGRYHDFLLVGPTGRIGLKLDYDKYQFFIETGPIIFVIMDFYIVGGGVIGIRF